MAMKLMSMIFFAHVLLAMMAIIVVASANLDEDYNEGMEMETSTEAVPLPAEMPDEAEETTSLRGVSRFLSQKRIFPTYTCNYFPRVCRAKNSPGPDCCKKKCVNVKTDWYNCGACGRRCKYTEICCKGKCVNASFDKRNCGGCQQRCKKGEYCVHGMCNYA